MRQLIVLFVLGKALAQTAPQIDWSKVDGETLQHFQALVRFDTTDPPTKPPGIEKPAGRCAVRTCGLDTARMPNPLHAALCAAALRSVPCMNSAA